MNLVSIVTIVISLILMTVIGAVAGVMIEHSESEKIRNILNDKYRNKRRKTINISIEDKHAKVNDFSKKIIRQNYRPYNGREILLKIMEVLL